MRTSGRLVARFAHSSILASGAQYTASELGCWQVLRVWHTLWVHHQFTGRAMNEQGYRGNLKACHRAQPLLGSNSPLHGTGRSGLQVFNHRARPARERERWASRKPA